MDYSGACRDGNMRCSATIIDCITVGGGRTWNLRSVWDLFVLGHVVAVALARDGAFLIGSCRCCV